MINEFTPVSCSDLEQGDVLLLADSIVVIDDIWYDEDTGYHANLHRESQPDQSYHEVAMASAEYDCRDWRYTIVLDALGEVITLTDHRQIAMFLRPMAQKILTRLEPYLTDGQNFAQNAVTDVAEAVKQAVQSTNNDHAAVIFDEVTTFSKPHPQEAGEG